MRITSKSRNTGDEFSSSDTSSSGNQTRINRDSLIDKCIPSFPNFPEEESNLGEKILFNCFVALHHENNIFKPYIKSTDGLQIDLVMQF
ncbi:hypothetical protein RchiOBHm_Chr5g0027871 [Rosa chinensis]|uniref:Uncharacterized protein n=1 Tax=Rosa chinensis TaxID=74649 RepID=A0A2P6Q985_ROSCH|nr:hypothetical protein RchiOBHm_Chr5g0027871 [Rosa chinensis]